MTAPDPIDLKNMPISEAVALMLAESRDTRAAVQRLHDDLFRERDGPKGVIPVLEERMDRLDAPQGRCEREAALLKQCQDELREHGSIIGWVKVGVGAMITTAVGGFGGLMFWLIKKA